MRALDSIPRSLSLIHIWRKGRKRRKAGEAGEMDFASWMSRIQSLSWVKLTEERKNGLTQKWDQRE